jgi:hypothetical protein
MGAKQLIVHSDSQLVVGQVRGEYEAREERMKKYLNLIQKILETLEKVDFRHIPREENADADHLTRLASSGEEGERIIEVQGRPSIETVEVSPIFNGRSWMTDIIQYLKGGVGPEDKKEAHKLRVRATRFVLLRDVLYKMGFSKPYLRCLAPKDANYVLREVHEGICGNHSGAKALVHKLTRAGYFWPSTLKDATNYVRACNKCQRFANTPRQSLENLTPNNSSMAFRPVGARHHGTIPNWGKTS